MWKYRCKTHLLALLASFGIGVLFGLITYFVYGDTLQVYLQEIAREAGLSSAEFAVVRDLMVNPALQAGMTGIVFAGLVNIVFLAQYVASKSSYAPLIFIVLLLMASVYLLLAGIVLLIPAIVVCIYGMVSLKSSLSFQRQQRNFSDDDEIVRIYKIHHTLDENVKKVALECKKNVRKFTVVYTLGVIAALCVLFFVQNFVVLVLLLVFLFMSFNYLMCYFANFLMPIRLLLYQNCDPEACASAIIYYSTNRNGKVKLKNRILLAQALIYMDDPQLAMDVLIDYSRRDQASLLQYWSLMATINYMLKDEDALDRCKEEAGKVRMNYGVQGVLVQSEELASIQNKVDLMNGQFNTCKKYYLQALQKARLPFQQVDACYYIGMISFVEQDYSLASMYFEKVISLGNKMAFVQKAKHFQSKIDAMAPSQDADEF